MVGESKMRTPGHLMTYAAMASLYFATVVGAILYRPSAETQTADTSLKGPTCEDARVLVALLTQQTNESRICSTSERQRQAHFLNLMRRAIY